MNTLKDLKEIYESANGRFSQYEGRDFVLPDAFKSRVSEINGNHIIYNKYSAVVNTRENSNDGLSIYLPNQWFYVASYFTEFYNELIRYKSFAIQAVSRERLKDLNGGTLTETELNSISKLDLDDSSKENLKRFITNYSWWHGGKTVDRGDFYVSPILNGARLVNQSQTYVAELCAFLADKPDLVKIIIEGEESGETVETLKEELLRQVSAATFLRKALKVVIENDANLSRLAELNKYKETNKQLKINGFNLWRKKDDLPLRLEDVYQDLEILYNNQTYVMYLEWTPADMENLFFPVFNKAYDGMFHMGKEGNEYILYKFTQSKKTGKVTGPLQQIFYGAPGTGKSFQIKKDVEDAGKVYFRTTFHPDSDYSTFVGCYKPTMDKNAGNSSYVGVTRDGDYNEPITKGNIIYSFTPQAFTNAYIKAWQTEEPVFLIIEEINRGNCAQIFGDLFQLLDRDENGYSQYKVDADTDLADYIRAELKDSPRQDIPSEVKDGKKLILPSNLYIWATMNTSDQSLFPIDSAFKRRWEWVYSPIAEGKEKDGSKAEWQIEGQGEKSWWRFIQGINEVIDITAHSEDKKLGFYFCKPTQKAEEGCKYPNIITQNTFVNKVVFYLWNDVFKVYGFKSEIFDMKDEKGTEKKITFKSFYNEDGSVNDNIVRIFVNNVMAKAPKNIKIEEQNEEQSEESNTEA